MAIKLNNIRELKNTPQVGKKTWTTSFSSVANTADGVAGIRHGGVLWGAEDFDLEELVRIRD